MNEETTDTPIEETPKTELIVEQSDIDKVFEFPIFEQVESLEASNKEILQAIEQQNEFLIPTEEELAELEAERLAEEELELLAETPEEELTEEELLLLEEEELQAQTESETIIQNLPLILDEMRLQNQLLQENQIAITEQLEVLEEQGTESKQVDGMAGLYMMWLIPLAVVVSIGAKVLNPFLRG